MAYSRRVPKVDIRSLQISKTTQSSPSSPKAGESKSSPPASLAWHNPASELRAIAWCGLPLIILLIVASIFDIKQGWVIPLAEWLMHR